MKDAGLPKGPWQAAGAGEVPASRTGRQGLQVHLD